MISISWRPDCNSYQINWFLEPFIAEGTLTMDIFLARQPIFDRKQKVYGYELLYRGGMENFFREVDGDKASLSVIRNLLLVMGSEEMTQGRKAFINFTKRLLLNGTAYYLPKEIGVVEILEDIEPDPETLEACRTMRKKGYVLALDDFVLKGNESNPFLEVSDIIKVDFRLTDASEQRAIAKRFCGRKGLMLLAEKTETREEFEHALDIGYALFQGYFFSKPTIISRKDIPGYKFNYLRLLKELNADLMDFRALQSIIERDPSLTFKLMKYINSAFFGLRQKVASIKQALSLLGEKEIRRWASLAALTELGRDQPEELIRVCLLRARLCEKVAPLAGMKARESELFLMGMFSCMDTFLGRPMEEVLGDIPLASDLKEALLGQPSRYQDVFSLVVSYEKADWEELSIRTKRLGLDELELPEIYSAAIDWVEKTFR